MHRRKCAQGSGLAVGIEANCIGNETSFLQCLSNYYICNEHVNDIGVRCAPGLHIVHVQMTLLHFHALDVKSF